MIDQAQVPRVFVDFHNADRQGRIRLNTVGTLHDLNRLGIILREGTKLILFSFELETEGTSTYSTEEGVWVAQIDWGHIQELPGNKLP